MAKKVGRYHYTMEKPEQRALLRLWRRGGHELYTRSDLWEYRKFRKRFIFSHMGCWLGLVGSVTVGIEPDGFTHT
jgi:hypothetical protein